MIAHELQNRLFRLGCRIAASSDHGMNLMQAAACVRGHVVFGSSFTGRNAELVRCFRVLRDNGIPTIALTQGGSPVAEATSKAQTLLDARKRGTYRRLYLAMVKGEVEDAMRWEDAIAIDPDLKRLLVVYKPGIIEILTAPPPPPPLPWDCPRCGAVDAVRWSARGCGACRLHAEASGAR